jgi:hypothetical protein
MQHPARRSAWQVSSCHVLREGVGSRFRRPADSAVDVQQRRQAACPNHLLDMLLEVSLHGSLHRYIAQRGRPLTALRQHVLGQGLVPVSRLFRQEHSGTEQRHDGDSVFGQDRAGQRCERHPRDSHSPRSHRRNPIGNRGIRDQYRGRPSVGGFGCIAQFQTIPARHGDQSS